ncbi:prepilin-type N-terminal cleavage/methylation domain-containing protein [Pseudomonas sp. LS44]|uniref:pilus assembly FimT family protein n=1 Tax=Pseudomonas sp. LS44 TaxID=1357074 RepID=UPI00215AA475|nr:prepilin-type N-terminal cleavage/methylation domain-containing protein [Pseudomonas sp. LS44]UVE17290.1 prepilin-type N-terminal cleavage/methylation domain-containing protein [Pseudomonas sp. LS44]
MKRQAGFSLIELMITIALIGLLAMLAGPFTISWSNSAQVRDAEGVLSQGIARAKAHALRNRYGVIDAQPVAALCLDPNRRLSLHEAASADSPASCSSAQIWSAQLPAQVSVQTAGATFSCLAFDSKAMVLASGGCSTNQSFALAAGSEHVTFTLN